MKEMTMNLIGTKTPPWSGTAYRQGEQKRMSSEDFANRWHVLYWYPLDFTWICPTEIQGFQALLTEFKRLSVDVVGVSTDSFYSHHAWFHDRKIFPEEITHPVLADTNHSISRAFDVLNEQAGIAYRATVIVDDKGLVRSQHINDLTVGRSTAEVLRCRPCRAVSSALPTGARAANSPAHRAEANLAAFASATFSFSNPARRTSCPVASWCSQCLSARFGQVWESSSRQLWRMRRRSVWGQSACWCPVPCSGFG